MITEPKYLVFGYSKPYARIEDNPDLFHGTTSVMEEEVPALSFDETEDGSQQFGLVLVHKRVTPATNLLQGLPQDMVVLVSYSHTDGAEAGRAVLAYLEIKDRFDE